MKKILTTLVVVFLVAFTGGVSHAAGKWFDGHRFGMWVVSDRDGVKHETTYHGEPFVYARPGERYWIKLTNPLPVRVAANLVIDGLNSLTGEPVRKPVDGMKWIIPPHGTIRVRGWQHGGDYGRRFYFTNREESYARWQGDRLGRELDVNCGVIAAAFFWSERTIVTRNKVTDSETYPMYAQPEGETPAGALKMEKRAERPFEAGTGSGERFQHDVDVVDFDYDTGMYRPRDMVVIYYDFRQPHHRPEPRPVPGYNPKPPPFAPDPYRD